MDTKDVGKSPSGIEGANFAIDINNPLDNKMDSANQCFRLCEKDPECVYFEFMTDTFFGIAVFSVGVTSSTRLTTVLRLN